MLLNAVLFQIGWLTCVLDRGMLALAITASILLVHVALVSRNWREYAFIALITLWGFTQDFLLMQLQVLAVAEQAWPPLWLVSLWVLFATTLNHSLRWFQRHLWLAVLAGGIAGPLSYLAGDRLGALQVSIPLLPVLSLTWALALPLMLLATRHVLQPKATS